MKRASVAKRNARAMKALGIERIDWKGVEYLYGDPIGVWIVVIDGKPIQIQTSALGATESTVIRIAAGILKDRPVRYVA